MAKYMHHPSPMISDGSSDTKQPAASGHGEREWFELESMSEFSMAVVSSRTEFKAA